MGQVDHYPYVLVPILGLGRVRWHGGGGAGWVELHSVGEAAKVITMGLVGHYLYMLRTNLGAG